MTFLQKEIYVSCSHCGVEFLATSSQRAKYRSNREDSKFCCSAACRVAMQMKNPNRQKKGTAPIFEGKCPNCSSIFQSKRKKTYCSLKCYVETEEFKQRLRDQADAARKKSILIRTGEEEKPNVQISCLYCGLEKILKPSRSKERFCTKICGRKYMAERFDRWIASPQSIALPQAYDEFLTQDYLSCLIEGCEWSGLNLGQHLNFTHGITAREFKRAAGFNLTTGLCTPAVSKMLSERPHLEFSDGRNFKYDTPPLTRNYSSLEGKEHSAKARALRKGETVGIISCVECGKNADIKYLGSNRKFCSTECCATNRARRSKPTFSHPCGECSTIFQPSYYQSLSIKKGNKVFCCIHCRQKNNSRFKR